MMASQWMSLSVLLLVFSLMAVNASQRRSIRQVTTGECLNYNVNICDFIVCQNGAGCSPDRTNSNCFKCACPAGFGGIICEQIVPITNECAPGCQNNGVCRDNVCVCPAGYTGTLCQSQDFCAPNNPCQNGGRCTSTATTYSCDCSGTGYAGQICTDRVTVDPCTSAPCQNGGLCTSNGATFVCTCANGYTGVQCQTPPSPCGLTPCKNGGECVVNAQQTFVCVCPPDWTGTQCETSLLPTHVCVTRPNEVCLNNGECLLNGPDYLCKCALGWAGINCEIPSGVTSCESNPCGAHGVCLQVIVENMGPGVICNCASGWTGRFCDVNMGDCPPGFCLNGGLCRLNGAVPVCTCPSTHTGLQCQTPLPTPIPTTTVIPTAPTTLVPGVNPCLPNPCWNGATCLKTGNSFFCHCVAPFTGPTCANIGSVSTTRPPTITTPLPDICASQPCRNNGKCYRHGNTFVCVCQQPFVGRLCETAQGTLQPTITTTTTPNSQLTCAHSPCRNGAQCFNTGNSYFCLCGANSNLTGKNCESTINALNCPIDCGTGRCVLSGNNLQPFICMCNGVAQPTRCP